MAKSSGLVPTWVLAILGLLVLALLGSWAYARLQPRHDMQLAGVASRVIRVQVLNGSGEGGIGSRLASTLREGGFHVVEVRNADRSDYFPSLVIARRADPAAARSVAQYLGGPPVLSQAWDSDLADVTVIIGSDRSRLRLDP